MPTGNTVVTAKTGPGLTNTAVPIPNVSEMNFNLAKNVLTLQRQGAGNNTPVEFDLAATTTVTIVITAGNYVLTLT